MTTAQFARFWLKVSKDSSGCWLWTGTVKPGGYGKVTLRGRQYHAHRAAWEHFRGPIPKGLDIHHQCRVRHCVNPKHMELVTPLGNQRRRREHEREVQAQDETV